MVIHLSTPSKSFLYGEYSVLEGGPCAIVNTQPRFQLRIHWQGQGRCQGIHPSSPAGQWMRQIGSIFQNTDIEFIDPHNGLGGLGASSAQFVMVYTLQMIQSWTPGGWTEVPISIEDMWRQYRQITWSDTAMSPSGADIIAQACGQVTRFSHSPFLAEKQAWPFAGEGTFVIVRTGGKVPTHKHLNELSGERFDELRSAAKICDINFEKKHWLDFCESVSVFAQQLDSKSLLAPESKKLMAELSKDLPLRAIKGCGAMGADTLILFADAENKQKICKHLAEKSLQVIGSETDLSAGVDLQMEFLS